ncbi:MAG: LysR family transcriptional regulator [Coprobacillus sp.]|nr:LysR family transcriptional regulator [Coprobacillus sp.]MDY4144840.1 LysR family transcriptional regulator [Bacilli bacterium]
MLDIRFKTLLSVIEEKNFSKAAEKLSLTQPAVSHHINQLEAEYGVKIISRGKREISLTPEGELIANYAKRMAALESKLLYELKNIDTAAKKIRIGVTHTAESNMFTEIVGYYSLNNPNISIIIITDTTSNLYKMVENYELDLAYVDGMIEDSSLKFFPVDKDDLVCVLSINNPLVSKKSVTLEELKKERLILRLQTSTTRKIFEASLEYNNDSIKNYNVVLEVDNIATIKDLIRKDFGISVLAKSACMDEVNKKKLAILPIEKLQMIRQNYIIYNVYFNHVEIIKDIISIYNNKLALEKNI